MRSTLVRLLVIVPLLAGALAVGLGAPEPAAAARSCGYANGDVEYIEGGTVKDSLVVPPGLACYVYGAVIRGGVTVGSGAKFYAEDAEIRGSVSGVATEYVDITGSVVRGSFTVTDTLGTPGGFGTAVGLKLSEVRGDVVVTDNTGPGVNILQITQNTVRGSVVFTGNRSTGSIGIADNAIGVDLVCADNSPVVGLYLLPKNTVGGAVSPDCAHLVG